MIHGLANKMASVFVAYGESSEENTDIYAYALESIIALFFNIMVCLLIAVAFGRVFEGVVFIIVFASLRRFTGGYHANTHFRCITAFGCIVFSAMILLGLFAQIGIPTFISIVISTFAVAGIFLLVALERGQKFNTGMLHKEIKRTGIWLIFGLWLLSIIDFYILSSQIGFTLALSMFSVFGSMAYAVLHMRIIHSGSI